MATTARKSTALVALPPPLLKEVGRLAKRARRPAAELVRAAVREYVDREKAWSATLAYGAKKAKDLGLQSERDIRRAIDEYRRGDFSLYVPARRR